jgi:transposase-like protein
LAFGFLGAHRFIVRQKMHGLVFLLLSIFTILFIGNPATEYIADISLTALLVLIAIDAITVLLTGRYIAFESNKRAEDNDTKSRGEVLDTDSLQHKIMCVRISKSIKQGLNEYDAARYAWKVSEQSISDVDFVLGVDDGIVVGVFKPNTWLPGDHSDFQSLNGFNNQNSDRFGFIGKDADKKVKNLYLNKTIQEMTGKQSGQNPVRFFGSIKNKVNQANIQKTSKKTGMPWSVPKAQTSSPSAPKTIVLIAYEINAETAKKLIQKGLGISANLKKFNSSEIIEHVASAWSSIEDLMYEQGISPLYKILYTAKLSDPLRIGQSRNDIINNSFLMSVISDNSMFGRQAIDGARFYDFSKHSNFEKKQLSIFLDEIGDRFRAQEIGIFCWIEIEKDLADSVVKQIASHFAPEKSGELHFLEFTHDGLILPNFANVSTQKFEGKLAGNYTLSLSQEEYQEGMDRLNTITETVVGSLVFDTASEQPSGAELGSDEEKEVKTKKSYSDDFKRQVALAANKDGATLASVGQQFDVSPTLVRNWKNKFSENTAETSIQDKSNSNDDISINDIQNWLQSAQLEGSIDGDGDLDASLELSEEVITKKPQKIYLTGSQKLASGGKSETFDFESEVTTNESNWLRTDYLNGVDKDDPSFALNMKLACHVCSDLLTIPITVKEGKVSGFPRAVGNIKVSELSIILEDGDYRLEGRLDGQNGFIYGIEASTEEPEAEQSPSAAKVLDDENTAEVYEFLWDVKKGDTVYLQLSSFAKLDGEIAIGFTGKAEVQEPVVYDEDEDFDRPAVEDIETQEGDIGIFEFQIKRGYVDEENIDDEEISVLVNELKELCENEEFEKAATLLLPKLSFEFGADQLDDDPGEFFADLDYIEIECTEDNTSVKVGSDGDLVVTISVQFEIPLQAGISTQSLVDYLPDSGAWAAASVSPGWGYSGSDGDNVWFLGIKGKSSSPDSLMNTSELDFSSLGDAPYNWYFNMLRKFEDYDLAGEKFTECVDEFLYENGLEEISWQELPAAQIQSLLDHIESLEKYNDPEYDEKVNGPLQSLIINAIPWQENEDESRFWPPDDDNRSSSDPDGCYLYFKGSGYEFSASRLNRDEAFEMKEFAAKNMDDFLLGGRFTDNAGIGYESVLIDNRYGPDPFDLTLKWEDYADEDPPIINEDNFIRVEYIDDPEPQKNILDFFAVAGGKVFGSVNLPINHPSEFDSSKLKIEYFEFSLDDYPEQYGRCIQKIIYDGWEIELEWSDNGLDVSTFLLGYHFDDSDEYEEVILVHKYFSGFTEDHIFDWNLLDEIFESSKKAAAKKSVLDLTEQPIGSAEFKIEVASACAESGMNYKNFAKLYNLNADELNAWAVEFLGEGFE